MNMFGDWRVKTKVLESSKRALPCLVSVLAISLISANAPAMGLDQMRMLPGARLLELRVDAVLEECGLPSRIAEAVDVLPPQPVVRWGDVEMQLSSRQWELRYSRGWEAAGQTNGWINPGSGSVACLADLPELVLHARGDVGFLSVRKRADKRGFITSYLVPDNVFTAHQVSGLTATWKQGMSLPEMRERYGNPDQILNGEGGIRGYRYWIVVKQHDRPTSAYAVDFETNGTEKSCGRYTVYTTGYEFVQEKLDVLQRQWERDYVLD